MQFEEHKKSMEEKVEAVSTPKSLEEQKVELLKSINSRLLGILVIMFFSLCIFLWPIIKAALD